MAYRLLLADDSITIQKVVELVLAEEDFEIKSVSNGEDALAAADTFKPDVILADIEMPKMNGYQLCERIKQNPATAAIPVILLAGAFEPIDEELARNVGSDDSIIKPFESQELISKINAALTMASAGAGADISFAEAEPFEIAEEIGEAEAAEVAGVEEDLWAMEDVTAAEGGTAEEEVLEEAGLGTAFAVPEMEIEEQTAPAEVFSGKPAMKQELVMPEVSLPSKEEFIAVFEKAVNAKVPGMLSAVDIRESLMAAITPVLKESVEKILWEIAPDLVEKMLKEILKESVASLRGEVEKVLWETVPDLAGTMISREIEKIKAEF